MGAARLRRSHQHLGQGQVPLGACPDGVLVGQQQVVRVCCSSTATCSAAASSCWSAGGWRRSIRVRCSPTATRPCSGPGCTGSSRGSSSGRSSPSTTASGPAPRWPRPSSSARRACFRTGSSRRSASSWLRRVKTQVAWHVEKFDVLRTDGAPTIPQTQTHAGPGDRRRHLRLRPGHAELRLPRPRVRGDDRRGADRHVRPRRARVRRRLRFWKAGGAWEQGIRFFKSHNLIYAGGAVIGHDLPFWNENTAGGTNLRGYLGQQFRGDTQLWGKVEYHFPLFSVGSLDFRALGFYDVQAVWYRDQPNGTPVTDPNAPMPPVFDLRPARHDRRAHLPEPLPFRVQPRRHPQRRRAGAPVLLAVGRRPAGRGRLRLRHRSPALAVHHRRRRVGALKTYRPECQELNTFVSDAPAKSRDYGHL